MPTRSKWQSLPTEAINPATLAIDKQPAAGIVDLMLAEDRKRSPRCTASATASRSAPT